MSNISRIFVGQKLNEALLKQIAESSTPRIRYVVAITPRSGSSLLCDVMKNTEAFGAPDELINEDFIPEILEHAPARNPDEYLKNVLTFLQSKNGVTGLKASWFQFQDFREEMRDTGVLQQLKYIYLIRRDRYSQAVSLYKATSTSVFHTNVAHSSDALDKLASIEYDFEKIHEWYLHICEQEVAWQRFFDRNRIFPLLIAYEDLENDVAAVIKRIAAYLGVSKHEVGKCSTKSVFKKIGNRQSLEWACRFALELYDEKQRTAKSGLGRLHGFFNSGDS